VLIKSKKILEIDSIENIIGTCNSIYMHLYILDSFKEDICTNKENVMNLKALYNREIEACSFGNKQIEDIYNYHLKNIIKDLNFLVSLNLNKDGLSKKA